MVSIIGAGPVGNYLANLLAKQGMQTTVYEEHKDVGKPIACTGILTPYLQDIMKVHEDYVVNTIHQTNVYAPNGKYVNIALRKNFIVDRALFDSHLGEVAQSNGATYKKGYRCTGFTKKNDIYKLAFTNNKTAEDHVVVGADGPSSIVARSAGIYGKRQFVVGHQARVKLSKKADPDIVDFFLDKEYIGWSVPESEKIVRLGVASWKNAGQHFRALQKIRPGKLMGWQSGPIPLYNPKLRYEKDNIFLVGDAATQVKATTYGGIIPGMHASDVLCNILTNDKPPGSYEKEWRKKIGKELWLHLMMRKIMDKFSQEDYNKVIVLTAQEKICKLIKKYDREYPSKLLLNMAVREPRFLAFSKFLF